MDTLNLTKKEFKHLLTTSALVPVISLIAGIYIANSSFFAHSNQWQQATAPTTIEPIVTYSTHDSTKKKVKAQEPSTGIPSKTTKEDGNNPPLLETRYMVQAGLFADINNANDFLETLIQKEISAQIIEDKKNDTQVFRVIIGSFESQNYAEEYLKDIEGTYGIKLYLTTVNLPEHSNLIAAL